MNWRRLILLTIACGAALTLGARPRKPDPSWWREARFGMFIHLGLYSVAAGEWNGEPVEGIGEWIQNFARIPNDAYAELAADFALQRRAPDAWAEIAERAGARYVVFTAKHHDGFCLYPSDVSDFDIELTPCGYDPVKELIAACRRRGLKVGIYYSHRQDWHEEDAAVMQNEYDGHYGKPKSEVRPDLDRYIREKALPQVRELLGRYGRIDLLWYDTPFDLTEEQSRRFVEVVREMQPDCLVNGRVGYELGDYGALGDNEMPCALADRDLEMVATLNHTWGYKKNDCGWKDRKEILCSLIESVSRNINYMVNIGPRADGSVPQPSVDVLDFVGEWLRTNSEAVYGATGNPFNDNFPWGFVTRNGDRIYLHLTRRPADGKIELRGLNTPVRSARVLGAKGRLPVDGQTIRVPEGLEYDRVPVIRLDFGMQPEISRLNLASEGVIRIPAASGTIVPGEKGRLRIANGGNTEDFNPGTGKLVLTCEVDEPGTYDIDLYTSRHWRRSFAEGTEMTLKFDSGEVFASCPLGLDEELENVRKNSYPETRSRIGTVVFDRPGTKRMELSVDRLGRYRRLGFFGEDIRNESDDNIRVMRLTLTRREGRN